MIARTLSLKCAGVRLRGQRSRAGTPTKYVRGEKTDRTARPEAGRAGRTAAASVPLRPEACRRTAVASVPLGAWLYRRAVLVLQASGLVAKNS